ncbi:hypothetical protein NDU88_008092 [Pleurodeles waltl]|uniref:Uncharacterized protein n=1 Tax=Pleurodeles waltl TaxID=8319 RepID=A0AAV7SUB5_PLEWA|nr:hypothetical protein NDU88_008092 [Pleurodeles waltl]
MRARASEENGERGAGETSGVDRGIEQQQESDPEPRGFDNVCDGLLTTDPSEEAARVDTATAIPEGDGSVTNPLRLPGPEEQRQRRRAARTIKGMRAWASKENGERGAGETSGVDRRIEQQQESDPEPRGLDEQPDSGPRNPHW